MTKDTQQALSVEQHVRDPARDWETYVPEKIPSKGIKLPLLFHKTLEEMEAFGCLRIFEMGCGCGDLAVFLQSKGHNIVGTDINAGAVQSVATKCPAGTFFVEDVTCGDFAARTRTRTTLKFDFVILQLLLSIVGGPSKRRITLENAFKLVKPGGVIFLSCSGVSDTINPTYAELYQQDQLATGERHSYFSRNCDSGDIMYMTHHFEVEELRSLLCEVGFVDVQLEQHREASSRRPTEAAYFLYATARCPKP